MHALGSNKETSPPGKILLEGVAYDSERVIYFLILSSD